jgi:putative oxidoreductase
MKTECKCSLYGPSVLRLFLGLLFLIPGLSKLMNPSGIIGMLGGLGFPGAAFWGWLLIIIEIVFGILLLIGWKTKYIVWPLVVVLLVALFTVTIPNMAGSPINLLFHLLALGALVSLFFTGAGAVALDKE